MNQPLSHLDRRDFLFLSSGAAAGVVLAPGLSEADTPLSTFSTTSGLRTGVPVPLKYVEIPGFLSSSQLDPHHAAHYGGALKKFVEIEQQFDAAFASGNTVDPMAFETMKRLQSSRGNSVMLHELYFQGMAQTSGPPPEELRKAIELRFGSLDRWASDFIESAKIAAGWAILVLHPINGRLYNLVSDEHAQGPLWFSAPLVVIDTYEHAFYVDYVNRKSDYVEKFVEHVDWHEADHRYRLATAQT